jgi:hypothetical protein
MGAASALRRQLNRFPVIIALCALCISAVIGAETIYIVGKTRGHVQAIDIWPLFVPVVYICIINRRTFHYIILALYCVGLVQATAGAWLLSIGTMPDYETIAIIQGLMWLLSLAGFLIYSTIPLFGSAKPAVVISCLIGSYFLVFLILTGFWCKALMIGLFGSLIFSTALFAASFVSRGRPWRAFWIANAVLILLFGGAEVYSGYALTNPTATGFGGYHLWIDGHITAAGVASVAFDIAICTVSNFLGFYASRFFVARFNLK